MHKHFTQFLYPAYTHARIHILTVENWTESLNWLERVLLYWMKNDEESVAVVRDTETSTSWENWIPEPSDVDRSKLFAGKSPLLTYII